MILDSLFWQKVIAPGNVFGAPALNPLFASDPVGDAYTVFVTNPSLIED